MKIAIEILYILMLLFLFYEDYKKRLISLWAVSLCLLLGGFLHFLKVYLNAFLIGVLINTGFVVVLFSILLLYAKLKMKKKIFQVFGIGDLLFFLVFATSLPTVSFIVMFVFSLFFSMLIFLILKNRIHQNTVPLAGLQSLFFALILSVNLFCKEVQLYSL
jgi:hypothetical protein